MKATGSLLIAAAATLLCGCGATVPMELSNARVAYTRASEGPAAKAAPVELHAAQTALAAAEKSWKDDSDSYVARDLAYVAQRKAEMAEAQASISTDQASSSRSNEVFRTEQTTLIQERDRDLSEVRTQLAVSEQARQGSAEQLVMEQEARLDAEQRLTDRVNQAPVPAPAQALAPAAVAAPAAAPVAAPAPLAAPAPAPVAAPAPAPAPVQNRDPSTQVVFLPSTEASVDQRVAEQVARLDSERKAAEQDRQIMESSRQLNEARTALALAEQSGQNTAKLREGEQALADAAAKQAEQGRQLKAQSEDLEKARAALAASEKAGQASATELATAQTARLAAEKNATDAKAELAKLAGVKDTARGQVFTLSGGLIFRTNEATLMPGAERQLDQLVLALASSPDRLVVVEGYTDSQGAADHNLDLSQRRADAVRNYLMLKGYSADQVQARGVGEESPIADNATSEGRANNRRVEIVLGVAQK